MHGVLHGAAERLGLLHACACQHGVIVHRCWQRLMLCARNKQHVPPASQGAMHRDTTVLLHAPTHLTSTSTT